eukprot:2696484-Pleurochrysis_carterae.AAC.3
MMIPGWRETILFARTACKWLGSGALQYIVYDVGLTYLLGFVKLISWNIQRTRLNLSWPPGQSAARPERGSGAIQCLTRFIAAGQRVTYSRNTTQQQRQVRAAKK